MSFGSKFKSVTTRHPRPALVHIALRRGEGNGPRHRAGMTSPPALFARRQLGATARDLRAAASFPRRRRPRGAAQRPLLEREDAGERDREAENGGGEDPPEGLGRVGSRQHRARPHPPDIPRITGAPASTIAPKAETMKVEPRARKKFIVPVATPSWWSATAFCTTTTVNGNVGPNPSPTSAISPSAAAGENPVGA